MKRNVLGAAYMVKFSPVGGLEFFFCDYMMNVSPG